MIKKSLLLLFNEALNNSEYAELNASVVGKYMAGKDKEEDELGLNSCLQSQRKSTKNLSDSSDSNPIPPKCKAGVPTSRQQRYNFVTESL